MKRLNNIQKVNIVFLVTLIVEIIASYLPIGFIGESYVASLIYSQVILAAPAVIYLILDKRKYAEVVRFKPLDFKTILMCVLFYILIRPLLTLANALSMLYSTNTISDVIYGMSEECPLLIAITIIAIIPAFLEETVYRGVFYNEYRKVKPLTAVILSGFMFGVMHGNLNQFTYAFLMGMIFAMLIEATDSIFSTMIVHFCTNALSTILMYALPTALETMKTTYEQAVASGDTAMADTIEAMVGTDFDMESLMGAAQETTIGLGDILRTYLLAAVVFTIAAFFLYRAIAKRNGRWESICGMFGKKVTVVPGVETQHIILTEADMAAEKADHVDITVDDNYSAPATDIEEVGEPRIFTWALIAGLLLALGLMVINELLIRGIIQ